MTNNGYLRLVLAILTEVNEMLQKGNKKDAEEFIAKTIHILEGK